MSKDTEAIWNLSPEQSKFVFSINAERHYFHKYSLLLEKEIGLVNEKIEVLKKQVAFQKSIISINKNQIDTWEKKFEESQNSLEKSVKKNKRKGNFLKFGGVMSAVAIITLITTTAVK
jgi:uncharacterized coiled-coil protein SlyX